MFIKPVVLIAPDLKLDIMRWRLPAMLFSLALMIASLAGPFVIGLNLGIDFVGGTSLEVRDRRGPADLAQIRATLGALGLGEIGVQGIDAPSDVLIRVQAQPGEDALSAEERDTEERVLQALGPDFELRASGFVGPAVSGELLWSGLLAILFSALGILAYVSVRFEWQYGVATVLAMAHDVISTIGFFVVTQLEFNLSSVAALLLIAGYSVNDTVVVFDRVREDLRRYKSLPLIEILNTAINSTLSRTTLTSLTTLLALVALALFGGEVIRGFVLAMIWGIGFGTYSSVFVAAALLLAVPPRRGAPMRGEEGGAGEVAEPATPG